MAKQQHLSKNKLQYFYLFYRHSLAVVVAFISLMLVLAVTQAVPLSDQDPFPPQKLHDVIHHQLGINKRDTSNLLEAVETAPNQCLHNQHFQSVMNRLIQVSVKHGVLVKMCPSPVDYTYCKQFQF